MHKATGIPLVEGINTVMDLPHTISYAVLYRERIDSFNELPKDKRPPRKMWDRPYELSQFLEKIWETKKDSGQEFIDFNDDEYEE